MSPSFQGSGGNAPAGVAASHLVDELVFLVGPVGVPRAHVEPAVLIVDGHQERGTDGSAQGVLAFRRRAATTAGRHGDPGELEAGDAPVVGVRFRLAHRADEDAAVRVLHKELRRPAAQVILGVDAHAVLLGDFVLVQHAVQDGGVDRVDLSLESPARSWTRRGSWWCPCAPGEAAGTPSSGFGGSRCDGPM